MCFLGNLFIRCPCCVCENLIVSALIHSRFAFAMSNNGIVSLQLGEWGSGFRSRGEVQDFYKLRDYHLRSGTLFEDPEFPPVDSSLFYSQRPDRHYEWKRPGVSDLSFAFLTLVKLSLKIVLKSCGSSK